MKEEEIYIETTIGKVIESQNGGYFVAYPRDNEYLDTDTLITCSLSNWDDTIPPEKEQVAVLSKIRKHVKGWRANKAQPKKLPKKTS